jgi:hypothetical protein
VGGAVMVLLLERSVTVKLMT